MACHFLPYNSAGIFIFMIICIATEAIQMPFIHFDCPILFHHWHGNFSYYLVYFSTVLKPFYILLSIGKSSPFLAISFNLRKFPPDLYSITFAIVWIPSNCWIDVVLFFWTQPFFGGFSCVFFFSFVSIYRFRVNQHVITSNVQLIFRLEIDTGWTIPQQSKLGSCELYTKTWFMLYWAIYLTIK